METCNKLEIKIAYQIDNLVLSHLILLELAQEPAHLDCVTAEQIREPLEHCHDLILLDSVVKFKQMEDLLHLLLKLNREQFWDLKRIFNCLFLRNTIFRELGVNLLNL